MQGSWQHETRATVEGAWLYRYVQEGRRLDYSGDTRMHLTSEEQSALAERTGSHATAEPSSTYAPHFICECYFMTARALHLGYIKAYTIMEHMGRVSCRAPSWR